MPSQQSSTGATYRSGDRPYSVPINANQEACLQNWSKLAPRSDQSSSSCLACIQAQAAHQLSFSMSRFQHENDAAHPHYSYTSPTKSQASNIDRKKTLLSDFNAVYNKK